METLVCVAVGSNELVIYAQFGAQFKESSIVFLRVLPKLIQRSPM